jgi:phasin family protein
MSKKTQNPFADLFAQNDFSKFFENYQSMPFDMNAFLETQRKNVEALTNAQQLAMGGLQALAQRQSEILSQIVEDNSSLAKGMMSEGTPEEKISKNAKLFKTIYERSIKNMKELSEMINKSNMEASEIINKRVTASMNEIQTSLEKTQKKAA